MFLGLGLDLDLVRLVGCVRWVGDKDVGMVGGMVGVVLLLYACVIIKSLIIFICLLPD